MKIIGIIVLLTVSLIVSAQTAHPKQKKTTGAGAAAGADASPTNQYLCCRYPLRAFGQNVVNLTPLFLWWKQNAGGSATAKRPLHVWHRLVGSKVSDLGYSWMVDADIYTNSGSCTHTRIILKNPPTVEEQTYYQLKGELAAAYLQMTNDQRTYEADTAAAQKAQQALARTQTTKRGKIRQNKNGNAQQAAQDQQTATEAIADEKQLEQVAALAQKKFNAIPAANGAYRIDLFAMEIGRDVRGVPIYDMGVVNYATP